MTETVFESIEALQAAADGLKVSVADPSGRFAEFTKAANGLVNSGITVPWEMFTGSVKAGYVRDATFAEPQPGEWWQHGRWWFYISRREDDQVWYATIAVVGSEFQVNNWYRRGAVSDFTQRQSRVKADQAKVPEVLRSSIFTDLLSRYHTVHKQYDDHVAQVQETAKFTNGTFQRRLTASAERLGDQELDGALASVGWGRPRDLPVVLTISGTCVVAGDQLIPLIQTSNSTSTGSITVSRATVRFNRTETITVPIETGTECLCRHNFRDQARQFFPENIQTVNVVAQCSNH